MNDHKKHKGFTLLELLIVIAIIGILSTILMVVIKPQTYLARARDTERRSDIFSILSAVWQYQSEHSGSLPDTDGDPETSNFPTTPTCIGTASGCFDLAGAGESGETIVPVYMPELPVDPTTGDQTDTGYMIHVDENNHLVGTATGEMEPTITYTR